MTYMLNKGVALEKKLCNLFFVLCFGFPFPAFSWGFFAHQQINRYAVATLPAGMFPFYKLNLRFLTEKSVNADKRKYAVPGESAKHFIDFEFYKNIDTPQKLVTSSGMPINACPKHGQLPWNIIQVQRQLTKAFLQKDKAKIIKLSADLGHYVADAHVPLHTTENYNGQMTNQEGIHTLWESRLPMLFFETYDFFVGPACYIQDPADHIWEIIKQSHRLVHDVLRLEHQLSQKYSTKYSFEYDGNKLKKQYTREFSMAYHNALNGQVEQCFRQAVLQVGNFWLTAWINAGSPNLDDLLDVESNDKQYEEQSYPKTPDLLKDIRICQE